LDYAYGSGSVAGSIGGSIIIGDSTNDTLQGKGADGTTHDTLYGGGGDDVINGGHGDNTFYGGTGHNTLNGGDGINLFIAGSGSDDMTGNGSSNTADYSTSPDAINASLATGTGTHGTLNDTYNGIQNLIGSSYDDTLTGDSANNILTGGAGKDSIYANQGHDSAYGGDNNDTFFVSSLLANLPTIIDGGARDAGVVGNVMVLQDLVTGSYNMANLAAVSKNIDTVNIVGDSKGTTLTIASLDIQRMVNNGASSQLYVNADNGDALNISLDPGQSVLKTFVNSSQEDYTIYNDAAHTQIAAQVHWHHTY
jgi:Ca2+-binding RTX toxin-like protein